MFNTKLSDAKCNTKCETVCSLNSCGVLHIVVTRECGLSDGLQTGGRASLHKDTHRTCGRRNRFYDLTNVYVRL